MDVSKKPISRTSLVEIPAKHWAEIVLELADAGLSFETEKRSWTCVWPDDETPPQEATPVIRLYTRQGALWHLEVPTKIQRHVTKIKAEVIARHEMGEEAVPLRLF